MRKFLRSNKLRDTLLFFVVLGIGGEIHQEWQRYTTEDWREVLWVDLNQGDRLLRIEDGNPRNGITLRNDGIVCPLPDTEPMVYSIGDISRIYAEQAEQRGDKKIISVSGVEVCAALR